MARKSDELKNAVVPVSDAFMALNVLSYGHLITSLDAWRHGMGNDALVLFDPVLVESIRKQPPSKFGPTDTPSIWTGTHFLLALPALSYAMRKYSEDPLTRSILISKSELDTYFLAFPFINHHFLEYEAFVNVNGEPTIEWWDQEMQSAFQNLDPNAPIEQIIAFLPAYLRAKVDYVRSGKGDSLAGRIVLAYLLYKKVSPEALKLDPRSAAYVESIGTHPSKSLYVRFIEAQQMLSELRHSLGDYQPARGLELGKVLQIVRWYGRPHLVEMMQPGLLGAAQPIILSLLALFYKLIDDGCPDYTRPPIVDVPSVKKFRASQSLEQVGRISLVKDIFSTHDASGPSDGAVLRNLMSHIYSESERLDAWGNTQYYVPDSRPDKQPFPTFKQDIGNIIYCAGLVIEHVDQGSMEQSFGLKQLAKKVINARGLPALRNRIRTETELLEQVYTHWLALYPDHERTRQLRFILQTFGIMAHQPIAISLKEINKSFQGSQFDGKTYHLAYREADEAINLAITIPSSHYTPASVRQVIYHTRKVDESTYPTTADGLPYSAWLEISGRTKAQKSILIPVPGRGSFDPFGRTGSLHAGEVVGFGCSVHHACLSIALAELASLGAQSKDLKQVTVAFMRINKQVHERKDLAEFQLAQMIEAFSTGRVITISDYLFSKKEVNYDAARKHLRAYNKTGRKATSWAEPQAARLSFGYPNLYPYQAGQSVDPRCSWYDGSSRSLKEVDIDWSRLVAAK